MHWKYSLRKVSGRLAEYAFVLPAAVFLTVFIVYPLLYNIMLSVNDIDLSFFSTREYHFVGLQNYIDLWNAPDGMLKKALLNTLLFTVCSIPLQMIVSFSLALFLCENTRINRVARSTILVAYILPQTITAMVFKLLFLMDGGAINAVLMNLRLISSPIGFMIKGTTAMLSLVIANVWISMPFSMLIFTAGLGTVDPALGEAAMMDGAGWWRKLYYITIPSMSETIRIVFTLGFINTFKVFDLVFAMTGGGPGNATQMLSTYSYKLSFGQYTYDMGAVVANVLFVILLLLGLLYIRSIRKGSEFS